MNFNNVNDTKKREGQVKFFSPTRIKWTMMEKLGKLIFIWLFIYLQFWIKTNYPKKTIYEKIEQKIGINLKKCHLINCKYWYLIWLVFKSLCIEKFSEFERWMMDDGWFIELGNYWEMKPKAKVDLNWILTCDGWK